MKSKIILSHTLKASHVAEQTRNVRAHGAIIAKSCHVCYVFSGYKNQMNIARKWCQVVGERVREKPELQIDTHVQDMKVP